MTGKEMGEVVDGEPHGHGGAEYQVDGETCDTIDGVSRRSHGVGKQVAVRVQNVKLIG